MSTPLSDIQIYNMSLAQVGSTQIITSPLDQSNEASLFNLYYYFCRDLLVREFSWPTVMQWVQLNQVSVTGTPANAEWLYSYRWPSDCLTVRRLMVWTNQPVAGVSPPIFANQPIQNPNSLLGLHEDVDSNPILYGLSCDVNGRLIVTNAPSPLWLQYTQYITDPTQFAQDFAYLLMWRVAMMIAMPLGRTDDRRAYCERMFEEQWAIVTSRAKNEMQSSQNAYTWQSEFMEYRNS